MVAHEVGHHVQNLLGINRQVSQAQRRGSDRDANALSVQMELQADCFAGVWGHHAARRENLDPGDVDEGRVAVIRPAPDGAPTRIARVDHKPGEIRPPR